MDVAQFAVNFEYIAALHDVAVYRVNTNERALKLGDLSRIVCREELLASIVLSEEGDHGRRIDSIVAECVDQVLKQGIHSDLELEEPPTRE